ncbi:hypothetical protein HGO37_19405 [Rhizobium sp. CG4]|uniref:hypothetical protein n=1 Tax=Rhizobium sp. CG4 TaxID=2726075 RepID=UPI0020346CAF|nr:hypothetical protein [Rhizobium sp. CG4]MCM2457571.1 hypothetical protein [Rhizobium sp. CG4]
MNDDDKPITLPKAHPVRTLARTTGEAVVELIPGANLLTNIYAVTHPPIEQKERQRWEVDITKRSNAQDEQLKSVIAAFLRMTANHQQVGNAQRLSFLRGGMVSTLEKISREGLTQANKTELEEKLESTASGVEELLDGLMVALRNMSDDPKNNDFIKILYEEVFGTLGKDGIRLRIEHFIMRSESYTVDDQKRMALEICDNIDQFNAGLMRLSSYATASATI